MRTSELIVEAARKTSLTQKQMREAYDALIETTKDALKAQEKVNFYEFGEFSIRVTKDTSRYNPFAGKVINIPPRNATKFKESKALKEYIND